MKAKKVRPGDQFHGEPSYTVTDVETDSWETRITGDDGIVRHWGPDDETSYARP